MGGAGRLPYLLSNPHLRGAGADPFPDSVDRAQSWRLWFAARGGRSGGPPAAEKTGSFQLRQCAQRAALQWRWSFRSSALSWAATGILTKPVLFAAWCLGKGKGRADTRSRRVLRGSPGLRLLPYGLACPQLLPQFFARARIHSHTRELFWVAWAPSSSWPVGTVCPREEVWWAQPLPAQRR